MNASHKFLCISLICSATVLVTPRSLSAAETRVTEEAVRAEYDRVAATFANRIEYKVRHILVQDREQALAALARIRSGEDFAQVANEVSRDPSSNRAGGDLGWSLPGHFVDEFSSVMISLAPRGQAIRPTQTKFGWHLIEVQDVRQAPFPAFEKVKDQIAKVLADKADQNIRPETRGPILKRETCSILEYPPAAVRRNEAGKVRLRYAVNDAGRVTKTEIAESSGSSILDTATQQWLESCTFLPAIENGRSVNSSAQMEYVWKIAP